jgi:hypothetical protein
MIEIYVSEAAVKTVIHFASKHERFPFQAPGISIVNGYAVGNPVRPLELSSVCRSENAPH